MQVFVAAAQEPQLDAAQLLSSEGLTVTMSDVSPQDRIIVGNEWHKHKTIPLLRTLVQRDVLVLAKWLQTEMERFNNSYACPSPDKTHVESLVLAAQEGRTIYNRAWHELTRQVTSNCQERGRLMADMWIGHTTLLETVFHRVVVEHQRLQERNGKAEAQVAKSQAALDETTLQHIEQCGSLQDDIARLQAQLANAMTGNSANAMRRASHFRWSSVNKGPVADAEMQWVPGDLAASTRGSAVRFKVVQEDVEEAAVSMDETEGGPRMQIKRRQSSAEAVRRGSKRVSAIAGKLLRSLHGNVADIEEIESDMPGLVKQNLRLKEALDECRRELFDVYEQVSELEAAGDEMVVLESRAETAENERDDLRERLKLATPRPRPDMQKLQNTLGQEGTEALEAAVLLHRSWPADDLACMLLGEEMGGKSVLAIAPFALGCLRKPFEAGRLSRETIMQVIHSGVLRPLADYCTSNVLVWLQQFLKNQQQLARKTKLEQMPVEDQPSAAGHSVEIRPASAGKSPQSQLSTAEDDKRPATGQQLMAVESEDDTLGRAEGATDSMAQQHKVQPADGPAFTCRMLVDFLLGTSLQGFPYSLDHYGCMHAYRQWLPMEGFKSILEQMKMRTAERVLQLDTDNMKMSQELTELRLVFQLQKEHEERKEENRRRREEEVKVEKRNPIEMYTELLASQDEAVWKEFLPSMGSGIDVPKLFRHNGKIRNRQWTKRETEKYVKEVWKEKLIEIRSGTSTDMCDFVFQFIQKKLGIVDAVVQLAYNLLYGVFKYSWDADCELFLKILMGEVKEDVYVQQIQLQEEMEALFETLDKANNGADTGFIPKTEMRSALEFYFRVGQHGGKTVEHFDELMQALDVDQPGSAIEYKKCFEEDREFNQGEFAEALRDQFLQERIAYFAALENAIFDEASHEELCHKEHVIAALLSLDPDNHKTATNTAEGVFKEGEETCMVKVVMKRLQRGAVKRHSGGVKGGAGRAGKSSGKKKAGVKAAAAAQHALDQVNQQMVMKGMNKSQRVKGYDFSSDDGSEGEKHEVEKPDVEKHEVDKHEVEQ